ncbi:hypothetical protein PEM37_23135 [Streptomyces sp. AD681]|uniref:hypothetical protein n=1 Tax=Streptomyces sp. AD681 TaxID=3019069 RepID=UPI0022F199E6|nr:hypothetical protein [Streptomyces sp. AD681]MDA5144414.1 hypothetical protein [Streptomyces sp. AD681]
MSELTGLTIFLFVLAAVLVLMACIKADRVRSWRESLSPSAPDLPDGAFVAGRIILVVMAVTCVVVGFQGLAVQDNGEWSDDELTSAVKGATQALDGSFNYGDPLEEDAPADFDGEYARKVEQEVVEHGGGDAPQLGVDAASVGPAVSDQAQYRITANGADTAFCMDVKRTHDGYIETVAPGFSGDAAAVKRPKYTFTVSSRPGDC